MTEIKLSLANLDGLEVNGPYRFLSVNGRAGFQPTSLSTSVLLNTSIHRGPRGAFSLWFCPLEDLTNMPDVSWVTAKDSQALAFPLVSDTRPARDMENSLFGLFWSGKVFPKLMAKFTHGNIYPRSDFLYEPWVYTEQLTLRRGDWYHVTVTWDRPAKEIKLYLNGILVCHNTKATNFVEGNPHLALGNPAMLVSEFLLEETIPVQSEVRRRYEEGRPASNEAVDKDLQEMFIPQTLPGLEIERDSNWVEQLNCPFTKPQDLEGWLRQGPQYQPLPEFGTTSEGLIIRTPDELSVDTRTYLWSPKCFEGDQWIEFDFRLESPAGLALLVVCASGPQREDFIADHGLPKGGGMSTIIADRVRNYHWEYVRRVEAMREDVETQMVFKNPWQRVLHYGCIPRLEQGRWYKLRFLKVGNLVHGSIDGQTVFAVEDNAFQNHGPVYDFGRIALRQMYYTTMRYRNLSVWTRPTLV